MKLKKVGFVILTWNSDKYILNCLNSIFYFSEIEAYVSIFDNGSTDSTLKLLENYKSNQRVIISSADKNLGTTKSRNIALSMLLNNFQPDFICILDSDTEIIDYEGFLKLLECLESHSEIGIIGPRLIDSFGNQQPSARNLPSFGLKIRKLIPIKIIKDKAELQDSINITNYDSDIVAVGYLMSACIVARKETFDKIGNFDEHIFYAPEDVEFCCRAWNNNFYVCIFKKCVVRHHWQRLSRKKIFSKHNYEHIKGLIYYCFKYNSSFRKKVGIKADGYNKRNNKK